MLKDAEKFKADDARMKERLEAKSNFEAYVFAVRAALEDDDGEVFTEEEKVSKSSRKPRVAAFDALMVKFI